MSRLHCDTSGVVAAQSARPKSLADVAVLKRLENEGCYLSASSGVVDLSIIVVLPSAANEVAKKRLLWCEKADFIPEASRLCSRAAATITPN